jgi:CheY-like chemotaxis protein
MTKIIIVDDEYLIRYSLSSVFQDPGTEVLIAADGTTALGIMRSVHLDVCFLDIRLPDMNGLDIMKQVRDISPWTRIIIMTGSVITDSMMRSIQENAHCLISKPFDLEQVRSAAKGVLAMSKAQCREESFRCNKDDSCIQWITDDYRKHQRKQHSKNITCYLAAPQSDTPPVPIVADVFDISESGMGILCANELRPGNLIQSSDMPVHRRGVVRWCAYSSDAQSFRAGIQFVAPEHIPYLMKSPENVRSEDSAYGFSA